MSRQPDEPADRERAGTFPDPPTKPRRKRVVLADSRAPVTVLRTVVELEEQTSYGEELVSQLIGTQLRTAVRLWISTVLFLAALPALFFFVPGLADVSFAGVGLPWLLIGLVPFPLLFGMAYWYNSRAERQEQAFVAMVEK
jgi:fatty acid desaturase